MTVLDAIIQSLSRAGEYNRDDQVAPAVILWPDKERQWEPVLPVMRERMPHLLTLGPYAANRNTGPAIWLRCMIGRTLPEANWPEKTIPILYLPGVGRQELRAVTMLLEGGWKKVKVVTDHGWLLMPGGLPKLDLPKYLTETRWGRGAFHHGRADV